MNVFDPAVGLAENLRVFQRYTESRSAASNPAKFDVPMVWELYMGGAESAGESAVWQAPENSAPAGIAFVPAEFEAGAVQVTYPSPVSGDIDLLAAVNDRIKTRARRYPHPAANEMEAMT